VKLLEKFEQSVERLIEGTTGSIFNQPLEPAEIERKLERAMLAGQRASVDGAIVPNEFTVGLHPRDHVQFERYAGGLARKMEAHLARVASERQCSVMDRIRVTIRQDDTARRRRPVIAADIVAGHGASAPRRDHPSPPPAQATSTYEVARHPDGPSASLHGIDGMFRGQTFIIPPGRTTVGRAPDNDIVLSSPDVSRRHARIESGRTGVRVEDLNSTNGTRVNGEPVRLADLDAQDEVAFGGQRFSVAIHANDRVRGRR
jgi:hypothetical protein